MNTALDQIASIAELVRDLPINLGGDDRLLSEITFERVTNLSNEIVTQLTMLQESIQNLQKPRSASLEKAIQGCIDAVVTYESDTFSASERGVTTFEAEEILATLMRGRLFDYEGFPSDVDGGILSDALDELHDSLDDYEPEFEEFSVPVPSDPDYEGFQELFE